jgi:hypothetical protein
MIKYIVGTAFAVLPLSALPAQGEEKDKDPSLVFEMGGTGEWGLRRSGSQSYGPEIGFEYDVIERWLEIEVSTSPVFSKGHAELGTDFLFKKPFEVTDRLEFMIGGGPEWISRTNEAPKNSIAAVAVTEFIYAPWDNKKVRLFVEPAYSYDLGKGHEQAFSVSAGLLIGIK